MLVVVRWRVEPFGHFVGMKPIHVVQWQVACLLDAGISGRRISAVGHMGLYFPVLFQVGHHTLLVTPEGNDIAVYTIGVVVVDE